MLGRFDLGNRYRPRDRNGDRRGSPDRMAEVDTDRGKAGAVSCGLARPISVPAPIAPGATGMASLFPSASSTQLREVEKERDTTDAQDPVVEQKRQLLVALHGVGATSAAILAREVFARSFASRRQLGSYLGLTPSAYDSGSTTRCQGISKAGNSWARRILIEVAWLWQKYQPASPLSIWYIQRTAGQSSRIRRIMLIALARKLAISLWRYVETGLVPEGVAIAKAKLRPA